MEVRESSIHQNRNSRHFPLIVSFIFLVVIMFLLVLVTLISSPSSPGTPQNTFSNEEHDGNQLFKYKYLTVDHSTDSSFFGTIERSKIKEEEGFKSYKDEIYGNYALVHSIGLKEFECTGSCSCEGRRRSSSVTIFNSVKYLVAAISTVLAYEIAENLYHRKCQEIILKEEPTCQSVKSKVDGCGEIQISESYDDSTDYFNIDEDIRNSEKGKVLHAFVSGRVQGVFFRETTKEIALQIGEITGYVQNLRDGRVEVHAESLSLPKLEEFLQFLHKGSTRSKVEDVDFFFELGNPSYDDFYVMY